MTTVAQLIEYLQTLPPHTTINVAVNVQSGYYCYTGSEELELPGKKDDGIFWNCSDNIDYYDNDNPSMFFGRT